VSREREAKIFVVTEEDSEGDTWIETAWHHKDLADRHANRRGDKTSSVFMVTEMTWDWRDNCFKVVADE
jgi:hypothetical protein